MFDYTAKDIERFWSKVQIPIDPNSCDCWLWLASKHPRGYGMFGKDRLRPMLSHRVAWIIAFGKIPEGLFVCHHCDNPSCVNPNHLFLGTAQDNVRDMMNKGRHNPGNIRGEKHGNARLSDLQIEEIRHRYEAAPKKYGMQLKLAKEFGVAQGYIWGIVHYKNRA